MIESQDKIYLPYLKQILKSIQFIRQFTYGVTKEEWLDDEMNVAAVLMRLEILGESASKLPISMRQEYSDIPWSKIIALRNRIAHEYDTVDVDLVWNILQSDLLELEIVVKNLLTVEEFRAREIYAKYQV